MSGSRRHVEGTEWVCKTSVGNTECEVLSRSLVKVTGRTLATGRWRQECTHLPTGKRIFEWRPKAVPANSKDGGCGQKLLEKVAWGK